MTSLCNMEKPEHALTQAQPPSRQRVLKVSIVREELVELTGDPLVAIVLNQLLYWTERVKDFDLLLEEERKFNLECNVSPRHGWIYKTADELTEETMLRVSHPTMRKYLKLLVEKSWVDERAHPLDKWNKTTQYRVNIRKLQEDLKTIGHTLPDVYRGVFSSHYQEEINTSPSSSPSYQDNSNINFLHSNKNSCDELSGYPLPSAESSNIKNLHSRKNSSEQSLHSSAKNFDLDVKNLHSNVKNLHSYTYTEITPENTNREHAPCTREGLDENFFEEILKIWKLHVGQEVHLTEERKRHLKSLFAHYFQNDLSQWEQFCERVQASPFLMGEGKRRWHVTFDWILAEGNALKVLEGNFDRPEDTPFDIKNVHQSNKTMGSSEGPPSAEKTALLYSIADPQWKEWCTQLIRGSSFEDPISMVELQGIVKAQIAEFDGRLVWIECEDQKTLNRIEDLRFKLLSVVQKTFPQAQNIRTQLKETLNSVVSESSVKSMPLISDHPQSDQGQHRSNQQPTSALTL
ncbi:MAG: hypothetical protein BGO67_10555 [Alphaproteobacteria bacterium 41-28]|nr:MAG: hypothetical protein BGO67_10555 [Alphaproteobacteria bacterium 41-28]